MSKYHGYGFGCEDDIISTELLFIIALFFLSCIGCGRGHGAAGYGVGGYGVGGYGLGGYGLGAGLGRF